ncbi:hypothetical protein BDQ17DRAFT_1544140 [Cyathus striatus]|nr:hypothetical protein BDQ17DRAFT_1544140 [Cyathus striatus]
MLGMRKASKLHKTSQPHPQTEEATVKEETGPLDIYAIVEKSITSHLGSSGMEFLTSMEAAKKEAYKGYRPKKPSSSSDAGISEDSGPMIGVSAIVCIPQGFKKDGTLVSDKALIPGELGGLIAAGLAVQATTEEKLQFGRNWTEDRCKEWLAKYLPKLFTYAAKNNLQWFLLRREKRKLFKRDTLLADGEAFHTAKSRVKGKISDSRIYITFSKPIPPKVYQRWIEESDEEKVSDTDDEDGDENEEEGGLPDVDNDSSESEWMGLGSAHDDKSEAEIMDQESDTDLMDTLTTSLLPPPSPPSRSSAKAIARNVVPKHKRSLSNKDTNVSTGTLKKIHSKRVPKRPYKHPVKRRLFSRPQQKEQENVNPMPSEAEPLFLSSDSEDEPMFESDGTINRQSSPQSLSTTVAADMPPSITLISVAAQNPAPIAFVSASEDAADLSARPQMHNVQESTTLASAALTRDAPVEFEPPTFDWEDPGYESMYRRKAGRWYIDHWASSYKPPTFDF